MKYIRSLLLGVIAVSAIALSLYGPFGGVFGAISNQTTAQFVIAQTVSPNIVVDGDVVTYSIRVENVGLGRGDVTITDDMGNGNKAYLAGTAGGRVVMMSGTQSITGIPSRYIMGTLESEHGVSLTNVAPAQVVLIQYQATVDDMLVADDRYSSVRNTARMSDGQMSRTGIRILGPNVRDESIACSSPAFGAFPDPSSRVELDCFANYLADTGRASSPPRTEEVAHELAIDTRQCTNSAARDFSDVNTNTDLQCSISLVHDLGVVHGYADGTFRPRRAMTRAEFTKVVLEAAHITPVPLSGTPTPRFTDVPTGNELAAYIHTAADFGVVSGYVDGTFRPTTAVRRDEATKMILRAFGLETVQSLPAGPAVTVFGDISPSDPLSGYVTTAAALGVVDGMNGNFYPHRSITRAEVTKVIAKVLGYLANGSTVIAS